MKCRSCHMQSTWAYYDLGQVLLAKNLMPLVSHTPYYPVLTLCNILCIQGWKWTCRDVHTTPQRNRKKSKGFWILPTSKSAFIHGRNIGNSILMEATIFLIINGSFRFFVIFPWASGASRTYISGRMCQKDAIRERVFVWLLNRLVILKLTLHRTILLIRLELRKCYYEKIVPISVSGNKSYIHRRKSNSMITNSD